MNLPEARVDRDGGSPRALRSLAASVLERENRLIRLAVSEWANPVSRSGLLLLVNTIVTGVFGLLYWVLAARLYPQSAVGRAGALVSASTLLSGVGQLNLSGMLMRFLPQARERSRQLVWVTYGVACSSALALTAVGGVGVWLLTSGSSALRLSPLVAVLFAASVAATVVFTLQDSVLIAVGKTEWVPAENGAFGVAKIVLLVAFASLASWGAIFASWMLPLAATIPLMTWLLVRFLPRRADGKLPPLREGTKRQITRFVFGDATAGTFTQTWTYLLPVLVTVKLGAESDALFYTAFLFSSTLDQVASNFSSALVVAGAHDPDALGELVRATLRRTYLILVPSVLFFVALAPFIVRVYGVHYAAAADTLRILALACLPKALLLVYYGVCRVKRQTHRSAAMQGAACIAILGGAAIVSSRGLNAIAVVVLAVQLVGAMLIGPGLARLTRSGAGRLAHS